MPPKKNRKNASSNGAGASGIVTRSQKSENGPVAEMTYYSTLTDGKTSKSAKNNIQVISKKKLASDPAHYAELVRF